MSQDTGLPRAVIVVPTYNEAHNIGRLIDILCSDVFPTITDWNTHVLVVDDSSPDGTAAIVTEKSRQFPQVHLLSEPQKSGIGTAYVRGFAHAVEALHADVVIEFDADFQHPPETIRALLNKITAGYDYVVGSRHAPGGSEPRSRNVIRLLFTVLGGLLARVILFFPGRNFSKVTDPTTGLKATRVKGILGKLDLNPERLYSRSFGYKVQLLSETIAVGARYAEIPLTFQNRIADESKFSAGTAFDILRACLLSRLNRGSLHIERAE